jgi:hypothetical protein
MSIVLILAVLITIVLFYVVVKVREGYREDLIYHEIKTQEMVHSKDLLIGQKKELLDLQKKIHQIKEQDDPCEIDPSKRCTLCDDKCLFRKEGKE